MGSTQVVVVAEQFVVLQKKQSIHIRKRYSPRLNVVLILTRAGGLRGKKKKKTRTQSCMTVFFFGSDNMSGYRPIE